MNSQANIYDRQRLYEWYKRNEKLFDEHGLSCKRIADKYHQAYPDTDTTVNTVTQWVKLIKRGEFNTYESFHIDIITDDRDTDEATMPDFSNPLALNDNGGLITLPESWAEINEPYTITGVQNLGVGNDFHFPYHDKFAVQAWATELKRREVDGIYLNGDILDCEKVSSYGQFPDGRYLKDEIEVGRRFIESLRMLFPDIPIYWKDGNHEYRLERYIQSKCPELANLYGLDIRTQMRLDEFKIIHIAEQRVARFGKLWLAHGHELGLRSGTVNIARQVRMRVGVNIMFGHWHKNQFDPSRNLADEVHGSWAIGSLCYLKPRYTGVLNQWTQGGATVKLHEDGKNFTVSTFQIQDGAII